MNLMEEIAAKTLPPGTGLRVDGDVVPGEDRRRSDLLGVRLAMLLVYLVLAGQYESWYAPISVILAVPLSLLGPMAVLTGLRIENNLYTQIGIILLIALSAKNAILIVEVALDCTCATGKPLLESAVEAARARFRPILMTSFAFILGVVPLVLATGAGANARNRSASRCSRACWLRRVSRRAVRADVLCRGQRFENWLKERKGRRRAPGAAGAGGAITRGQSSLAPLFAGRGWGARCSLGVRC
jgi:HAE1 family hydrophobic/amphiphilic exporter-1